MRYYLKDNLECLIAIFIAADSVIAAGWFFSVVKGCCMKRYVCEPGN